jgi:hypothetical protein|tara:strand:+ start:3898 stop:4053 length:156 start_codon:yes stop_codon:yes gene_type:complete
MWVVFWRVKDKIGKGSPVDLETAVKFTALGNQKWGPGSHWLVQIIEGGLAK